MTLPRREFRPEETTLFSPGVGGGAVATARLSYRNRDVQAGRALSGPGVMKKEDFQE